MENDSISSSSSESKLPLIVGVLGFILGAAGLVLGIKAKGAAQLASDEADLAKTQVAELGATIASKGCFMLLQCRPCGGGWCVCVGGG